MFLWHLLPVPNTFNFLVVISLYSPKDDERPSSSLSYIAILQLVIQFCCVQSARFIFAYAAHIAIACCAINLRCARNYYIQVSIWTTTDRTISINRWSCTTIYTASEVLGVTHSIQSKGQTINSLPLQCRGRVVMVMVIFRPRRVLFLPTK